MIIICINISQRKLYVSTSSATYYYDGSDFSSKEYTIHNQLSPLLTGHKIVHEETVNTVRSSVGISKNYIHLTISDGYEDVTGNYRIEYVELGTITVEKSTIKVVTSSATREFDGNILTSKSVEIYVNGELITGSNINQYLQIPLTDYAQIEEPGSIQNTVTLTVKKSSSNVNKNFDIEYEFGTLTITLTE